MPEPVQSAPQVILTIDGGINIGGFIVGFEWRSFLNGGYVIRARVEDPYLEIIKRLTENGFLKTARKKPTVIAFKIRYIDSTPTTERIAYVSDIEIFGKAGKSGFTFVAIDPPSWYLCAGNSNGKVYQGKISDVIKKVVSEYAPSIALEVSETDDNPKNFWPMMRQDPKTFIQSLLEWSVSTKSDQTSWMVASVDDKLIIKKQFDRLPEGRSLDEVSGSFQDKINQICEFNLISNILTSPIQSNMVTQGLSAVTGQYLDKETKKEKTVVNDENTGNKLNPEFDSTLGFDKPTAEWSTSLLSVPEFSGGELGKPYADYIDGRARAAYMNMLPMVMRLRITIRGSIKYGDSSELGISTITITWEDNSKQLYFLAGPWIIYGFHHRIGIGTQAGNFWFTDLYLYRLDYNANAVHPIAKPVFPVDFLGL